jgi:outer membrane protein TolC
MGNNGGPLIEIENLTKVFYTDEVETHALSGVLLSVNSGEYQYRSELEYRQSELLIQQQKKQIRIEVRNALYALQQSQARVASARRGRDLAQKTFDISKQEQQLGAGSNYQALLAQRDLALAESSLTEAETLYEKSRIELERAVGSTLESHDIAIDDAKQGIATKGH